MEFVGGLDTLFSVLWIGDIETAATLQVHPLHRFAHKISILQLASMSLFSSKPAISTVFILQC
jgi:hypothetical protein